VITPAAGVAFTLAGDGDVRNDLDSRAAVSRRLGIPAQWATVRQVHGDRIVRATEAVDLGEADAIFTSEPSLPVAVFTADCLGVVIVGAGGVGVAHAGWRGMDAGIIARLRRAMDTAGLRPGRAYLGPAIRACCFEVGPEVAERFEDRRASTSWGTTSVDLLACACDQLDGLEVWESGRCTVHEDGHHSHRASGTRARMAALTWRLPQR
jgi:YfiH family protein